MNPKHFDKQRFITGLKGVPRWIWITLGTLIFSGVVMWCVWFSSAISILTYREPAISLRDFDSQYHSFQIKLPKGWMPYESEDGIHGDPYLIIQAIEGGIRIQPTFDIARIEMPNADLDQIVDWGQKRATKFPNTTLNSTQYNSAYYEGILLVYTIPEGGQRKRTIECHNWITYKNPYGYIISLCTVPEDWGRLNAPYQEIIESFVIKD